MHLTIQTIQQLIQQVPTDKRLEKSFIDKMKMMMRAPAFNIIDNNIRTNIDIIDKLFREMYKIVCQTKFDKNLNNYIFCDKSQLDDSFNTPFNFIKLYVDTRYIDGLNDFTYLCMYYKLKNIPIFDLGDSLHKFIVPFNTFNDNCIKKILLSGNIYDNVYG